jgi:hypothetical protein
MMKRCLALHGLVAIIALCVATAAFARSLSAIDRAQLREVSNSGEAIVEEGRATGALPGTIRAYLTVTSTVSVSFTVYLKGGSISGHGSGQLKGNAAEPSFAGTMRVTRGTGHYAHAHGTGGFYGTLNRNTDAMIVQTTGTLHY